MTEIVGELTVDHRRARVYAEGWQSWSPASWYPATMTGPRPAEQWQHAMRFRPGVPVAATGLQAEGLLVVDPGTGAPARLWGSRDLVDVPTVRAELHGGRVVVRSTAPAAALLHTEHAEGGEAALAAYGDALPDAPGPALRQPPAVWCSWYRYFEAVTAADVLTDLRDLDRHALPVEVVQVDDGWSTGLGEGLQPAPRFGDLGRVADAVRGSGRRLGLWLAPFVVGADTTLAREHPDWLVGPAGRNWGQDLRGLDLTHPGVRELLVASLQRLVALGADYLKLDFLYAGAVPGSRHQEMSPVAAYRSGLELVRETVGPAVWLVGCGAPLLPSLGLLDAMRVSPDTFHEGGEDGSTGLRGLVPMVARSWQQGRWWVNDPDCVVARPSFAARERWAAVAREYGGLRSFSDRVNELDEWGLRAVRDLLGDGGSAAAFDPATLRRAAALALREVTR